MADSAERQADLCAFEYDLPAELIAQEPAPRRDDSRLMVVERRGGGLRHETFAALETLLRGGDLLVFNDVRVRPARLRGRALSGGAVELLLLREVAGGESVWECLGRPGRRLRAGARIALAEGRTAEVVAAGDGRLRVSFAAVGDVASFLERHGEMPLPPYIKRPAGPSAGDRERYQTVFAAPVGAVAAPTAGLHFTEPLLERLRAAGVDLAWVTLDVGPATFLPVRSPDLDSYPLEAERASIPAPTVNAIAAAKESGGRVIAVGTTTTRALESRAAEPGGLAPGEFWAGAFLRRSDQFRVIDGLLTNFHLPKSTLLVLVSAFAGRRRVLAAYEEAVRRRYRFYSYGDAMLIL
jgi:S-adenosylmethionine:tRNA ribosyltransferase-isomerase